MLLEHAQNNAITDKEQKERCPRRGAFHAAMKKATRKMVKMIIHSRLPSAEIAGRECLMALLFEVRYKVKEAAVCSPKLNPIPEPSKPFVEDSTLQTQCKISIFVLY